MAIKELIKSRNISQEDFKQQFEQEIAIVWTISSHPNIITLVGYSENPYCLITQVFSFFFFAKNQFPFSMNKRINLVI